LKTKSDFFFELPYPESYPYEFHDDVEPEDVGYGTEGDRDTGEVDNPPPLPDRVVKATDLSTGIEVDTESAEDEHQTGNPEDPPVLVVEEVG